MKSMYFVGFIALMLVACGKSNSLSPAGWREYATDQIGQRQFKPGEEKVDISDSLAYSVEFIPNELLFLQSTFFKPSQNQIDEFYRTTPPGYTFDLIIAPGDKYKQRNKSFENTLTEGDERSTYLMGRIAEDIHLVQSGQEVDPLMVNYIKQFGLKNELRIRVTFPAAPFKRADTIQFSFNNKLVSKPEKVLITIDKSVVVRQPKLTAK